MHSYSPPHVVAYFRESRRRERPHAGHDNLAPSKRYKIANDFTSDRTEGDVASKKRSGLRDTGAWIGLVLGVLLSNGVQARSVSVSSPDHKIVTVLSDDDGASRYRIEADSDAVGHGNPNASWFNTGLRGGYPQPYVCEAVSREL